MFDCLACAAVSRPSRFRRMMIAAVVAAACSGATATAQRLDKASQDWLKQYRLLVLPDEVKVLQQVKAADLDEFVRIFWARRNPAPGPGENPYRALVEKVRASADARFSDVGKKGSETACGQVTMLLGNPDEMTGREVRAIFDNRPEAASRYRQPERSPQNATRDGARRPELWTYKSNATRTFRMPGGDLKLQFDDGCEFDEGARTLDELARVAAGVVVHPEIRYEFGADGRLRRLETPAPATSPAARALLDQPRSDFTAAFEPKVQVPGQGGAYTAGILRGEPGAIPPAQIRPGRPLALDVAARAVPVSGSLVAVPGRRVEAVARPDGSFLTTFGLALPPGTYTVAVAVVEPVSGRAAVARAPLDVPDYAKGPLAIGPLMVLTESDKLGAAEQIDPYSAFIVGNEHLYARPGNVLTPADSLRLLLLIQNAAVSPETKKASLRAMFTILKDGRPVARGSEQAFDTPGAAASVGPIALTDFAAGQYLARVEVNDDVAKTRVVRETPFTVKLPVGQAGTQVLIETLMIGLPPG